MGPCFGKVARSLSRGSPVCFVLCGQWCWLVDDSGHIESRKRAFNFGATRGRYILYVLGRTVTQMTVVEF